MEYHGRRGRRGRNHSRQQPYNSCIPLEAHNFISHQLKSGSFLNVLCNFFIMSSLMAIVYLMLEYHCSTCAAKCDMNSIKKNIDDIASNLSIMKQNYHELEVQLSRFSLELPKIEGQIEILENLAKILESKSFGWDPKTQLPLPNVDVYLNKVGKDGRNISHHVSKPSEVVAAV